MGKCLCCNADTSNPKYCSKSCSAKHRTTAPKLNRCLHCNSETTNPKYCSKSCAAKHINKIFPKRMRKIYKCATCGNPVTKKDTYRPRKYCDDCREKQKNEVRNRMIGIDREKYRKKSSNQINGYARQMARRAVLSSTPVVACAFCGYSKHVVACHIKPISSFGDTATISEVNDLSNLILLCPNCHWELDHDLLDTSTAAR